MTENSKYHPLFEYLLFSGQGSLQMSFADIESILGARLPLSARKRDEWWSNSPNGHSQARAWMRANYVASKVNIANETVIFSLKDWPEKYQKSSLRAADQTAQKGMAEEPQKPYGAERVSGNVGDHPLFGIWKDKATLLPDHDYTKPVFSGNGPT